MPAKRALITRESLAAGLASCGLTRGDTVLVHCSLIIMGPVQGSRDDILPTYYNAFWDVLGNEGTLVVPAFFYEYGRDQSPYDMRRSPVSRELGSFAQYVASQPEALRSPNPIMALAAVGARAEFITGGGTGSTMGVDGPWDRLLRCEGKIMCLGVDLHVMTFIHYVEYMVGVPHLYNKLYQAPVTDDGCPVDLRICAQIWYREFDIEYDNDTLTTKLEGAGLVQTSMVGRGTIRCLSSRAVFDFLKERLKQDCFYLLKRAPKFVPGRVPMDGASGPPRYPGY